MKNIISIYINNMGKENKMMIALMLEMCQRHRLFVAHLDTRWEIGSTSATETVSRHLSGIKCHFKIGQEGRNMGKSTN
jgi:hypothetical protein